MSVYWKDLRDLLRRLEREHGEQLGQFQSHQEYLVMRDSRRALEILVSFENQLMNHMELEERYLLPLCEPVFDRSGQWRPQVYALEHRRIRELLASVRIRVAAQSIRADGGLSPGDIIDLLDEERVLKHLMLHHQTREATALYPWISNKLIA